MKKLSCSIVILLFVSMGYGQDKTDRVKLGIFSSHPYNFEYVNGKVKEIHYQSFHITDEDGKIVKGKPFTFEDAENVPSRQPWSYYYNELGRIVKMSVTTDPNDHWIGVVHYDNDRIENIYWLKEDTLMLNWDIVYLDNGNVERHWITIQNNEYTGKNLLILDKNGNVIKDMNYNKEGELRNTLEFTRNADGTLKTQKGIDAEGNVFLYISDWKCNEKGLLVSSYFNILGGEEVNRKAPDFEYEYDERGNWIKLFSRGSEMMTERTIEYYD